MKSRNIKRILIGLLALAIVGFIFVTVYIMKDRHMISVEDNQADSAQLVQNNTFTKNGDIKIGLIGDSWVANKKLDNFITVDLKSSGINAKIVSFGHPGAKSREILTDLISNNSNIYSSKSLLLDKNIKVIVVIAGVNDTDGHIGSDFYSYHMKEIVQTINTYNKLPLILQVPEYGIEEPEPLKSSIKHNLYKILFDNNKTDVIHDYRTSLMTKLKSSNLNYKIIPFDPEIKDFQKQKNLYRDSYHLNEKGNSILGTYIGNFIDKNIIN